MITKMKKLNAGGFSLVELMVVVAIIGILSAVAIPNFQRFQRKARQSEAKSLLGGISTAEEAFRSEWETYQGTFCDIGFVPTGNLRYLVGFAGAGPAPVDPNFMANADVSLTSAGVCAANQCSSMNAAPCVDASVMGTIGMGGTPTATTFVAGAGGSIGGTLVDQWNINEAKSLVNDQDGVN